MSAVKRKLKTLSLAEKLEVLEAVKRCQKKKDVAEQFGLPMSTLSTIIKNESDIMRKIQNGQSLSCKRRRIAEYPGLEECLLKWFEQCRSQNISVSGPLLQEKAQIFSKSLGLVDFRASNGWLEKFKRRQDLVFKKVCGESASVNIETCNKWKSELQDLLHGYEPDNIFNADQGIIKNFKSLYRKEVVRNMLDNMEEKKNSTIDVLQAMRMADKAWRNVTVTTIKNCYVHCGFSSSSTVVAETEDISISPPAEWNAVVSESGISFEDFVSCDDGVMTAGTLSDDEIIDSVAQKTDTNDLDDIEDVNSTCAPWVSIKEARTALNTLRNFIEQTSNSEEEEFSALYRLDNAIDREQPNYLKQKKITDFF